MSSIESLTSSELVDDVQSLALDEIRSRRKACQTAEEGLSLQRRLIQGRLDIVQAELYRRAGDGDAIDVKNLVAELPAILVEHGDRHLGPGRLTSIGNEETELDDSFFQMTNTVNAVIEPQKLSQLEDVSEDELRSIADQLDQLERSVSVQRHQLHRNIDRFQEEIVRRYKSGEASVDTLLNKTEAGE